MLAQRGVFNVPVSHREGCGGSSHRVFFLFYLSFFFLWLCCPLVEDVNFVSVLRIVIVSSPFCRVAVKCEAHGSDFLFLLKIPSKMGIFNV